MNNCAHVTRTSARVVEHGCTRYYIIIIIIPVSSFCRSAYDEASAAPGIHSPIPICPCPCNTTQSRHPVNRRWVLLHIARRFGVCVRPCHALLIHPDHPHLHPYTMPIMTNDCYPRYYILLLLLWPKGIICWERNV